MTHATDQPPLIFEVERDLDDGELEITLTTMDEDEARVEYDRHDGLRRLLAYPLGNKREAMVLAGTPRSVA